MLLAKNRIRVDSVIVLVLFHSGLLEEGAGLLRYCATSRMVAGSIPDRLIEIFDIIFPATQWPWVRLSL